MSARSETQAAPMGDLPVTFANCKTRLASRIAACTDIRRVLIAAALATVYPTFSFAQSTPNPACSDADPDQKHMLFMMLLVAPTGTKNPDWVLQSTVSQEFDNCNSCYSAAQSVAKSIVNTPTINLVGWCFPKALKPEDVARTQAPQAPHGLGPKKQLEAPLSLPLTSPLNLNMRQR
jgi:hypothetical protein